jgi:copper transport protein
MPLSAAFRGVAATVARGPRRAGLVALVTLAGLAATAPQALAHVRLQSSQPAAGAVLGGAPRQVAFRFSEAVEGRFGAVKVYDAGGFRVDTGTPGHVGDQASTFAVALHPRLPDGRYAATYRVISTDGHPHSGGVVFWVGSAAVSGGRSPAEVLADAGSGGAGGVTTTAFAAVRALDHLATALAIGLLAFLLLCWRRALAEVAGAERAWSIAADRFAAATWRMLLRAVALGLLVTALGVVFEGAVAAGTSVWTALDPAILRDTLSTRFGSVWGAKLLVWCALGTALVAVAPRRSFALRPATLGADGQVLARPGPGRTLALLTPAGALAVAPALAGHASTQGQRLVLVPSTIVHVTAMSVWLGGLVALAVLVPRATGALTPAAARTRLLSALLLRFSPLALAAVLALGVTGTLQSMLYLQTFGDLPGSAFGRVVLVKTALVLVLVGLGAVNRRRVMPRLRALAARGGPPDAAGRLLRRVAGAEVGLMVLALAATGALAAFAPPRAVVATGAPPAPVTARVADRPAPETDWKHVRHGVDTARP